MDRDRLKQILIKLKDDEGATPTRFVQYARELMDEWSVEDGAAAVERLSEFVDSAPPHDREILIMSFGLQNRDGLKLGQRRQKYGESIGRSVSAVRRDLEPPVIDALVDAISSDSSGGNEALTELTNLLLGPTPERKVDENVLSRNAAAEAMLADADRRRQPTQQYQADFIDLAAEPDAINLMCLQRNRKLVNLVNRTSSIMQSGSSSISLIAEGGKRAQPILAITATRRVTGGVLIDVQTEMVPLTVKVSGTLGHLYIDADYGEASQRIGLRVDYSAIGVKWRRGGTLAITTFVPRPVVSDSFKIAYDIDGAPSSQKNPHHDTTQIDFDLDSAITVSSRIAPLRL